MNFLLQYYTLSNETLPRKLVLGLEKKDLDIVEDAFENIFDNQIEVKKPHGKTKKLFELTQTHVREHQRFRQTNQDSVWIGLEKLKDLLKLKETPRILECYDVAIWQGKSPTASQIVFHEGKPDKTNYRYYHLQERPEGNNDFEMMKEVLRRRIPKGKLPDVFIVDGGKGQVNSFCEVLKDFDLDIPVVGIAKERSSKGQNFKDVEVARSEERLIIPNRLNPYILRRCPSLMRIAVSMRDEAHRFSRKLHHKKEHSRVMDSWFADIEGVGKVTLLKIQRNLDLPINELRELSVNQLKEKLDISEDIAFKIKEKLSQK